MCKGVFVCHGDFAKLLEDPTTNTLPPKGGLAQFVITADGKYAINADFLDLDSLDDVNLDAVPKIDLSKLPMSDAGDL